MCIDLDFGDGMRVMQTECGMPVIIDDGGRKQSRLKNKPSVVGDCVTRAVAIAAQLSYSQVWLDLTEINSKNRMTKRTSKRAKQDADTGVYTSRKAFKDYMLSLGFKWVPTMSIGSGCQVHLRPGDLPSKGRLVVRLSKHVCAVVDGVVYDSHDPCRDGTRCVYGYWIFLGS